jgi:O-antigen ligase
MAATLSPTWVQADWRAVAIPLRSQAVPVLRLFALTLMVIPSYEVFKPIGAIGYPAGLVGMFAFVAWGAASLLGIHDARRHRHPVRGVLCFFWLTALASYALMNRGALSPLQDASADRFLMQIADMTGVALLAAECLRSLHEVRRVLRVLCWGGAFCGAVAGLQFWVSLDLTHYLRLPGFKINADAVAISTRDALTRVTGTAIHPIELGVVAGMLLPIAIWVAIYDTDQKTWKRWAPVGLIAVSTAASVSRSAIVAVALAMSVFVILMPVRQRLVALAAVPFALAGVFVSAHGLIGTLASYFGMGTSDSSIAHRVNNWPYVESLVHQAPWLGSGGGTYIPSTATSTIHVLDDQYLHTAIDLGLIGVVALGGLFILPMFFALTAHRHSGNPELRMLCAALAGAVLAAAVCSAFFDSLSFPMFYNVYALVIGFIGAAWRFARAESDSDDGGPIELVPRHSGRPTLALATRDFRTQGG